VGFAVFGLASCIQFAKPAPSFRTNSWCIFCHMRGFCCFRFILNISHHWRVGGSAKGRPANDDTLLRKAWIYSLFIKAKTHSQAHSRWLGGRATKVARATESVSISLKSTITTTKKATPNGHSLILNLDL
jgi:hypothetical protein